ncbi:MAG: adenylate/guanylate cyclase domain-containing protein [Gammaproteobacteria bacterium]|nr:adenylate/guanylate cyclase domain-containing protein [Gammaproteobacteria bacterium]
MKYLKKMIELINRIIVTLKFSILSIFISLFVLTSAVLISIDYKSSSDHIIYSANQSMQDITKSLNQLFVSEITLAQRDAEVTASLILGQVLNTEDINEMIQYFYTLAAGFNIVQSVYWGDINGNYVSAEYEDDNSISSYYYHRSLPNPYELKIGRDVSGKIIEYKKSKLSHYDPRERPWFRAAAENKKPTWTDVYLYQPMEHLGITLATPVYEKNTKLKGVLGVDIRLDWISWYIDGLTISPNGIIFVVQKNGKLIAYPGLSKLPKQTQLEDIHEMSSPWISHSFDLYKKTGNSSFSFIYKDKIYLATYRQIPMLKYQGWLIGLVVPENDFVGELNKARMKNIIISLFILLLGIFLVSGFVNNIVKPIKLLIKETNKIKNFDLAGDGRIATRIKEVLLLSDAIYTMKVGLRAFKRYVPSELVKQLIKKGEHARLGGSKKTIVAFFSDIQDFTTISHQSDPAPLVSQLNEYFDALTRVILRERGTVDKYIGDSIMAFWGAPDNIESPCHHAANAALQFMDKLSGLNKKWKDEGKSPFYTRIGIHIGEAIVGNVGSSERINYTAVGDSINIASRLEGMNKKFNTSILVSEAVYAMIKDKFVLQEMGYVSLKGIIEEIRVYALISRKL